MRLNFELPRLRIDYKGRDILSGKPIYTGHGMKAYVSMIVHDKFGNFVSKQTKPSESFVKQYLQFIKANSGGGTETIKDILNNDDSVTSSAANTFLNQAAPGTLATPAGLVVGTGTGANTSPTQIALGTIIQSGSGAGQLQYGTMSHTTPSTSSTTTTYLIQRPFTNGTASTITVEEMGLYANTSSTSNTTTSTYMLARDLITQAITTSQTVTGQYTLTTDV